METFNSWGPETQAIRLGAERTHEGEHNEPIFTTSSFVFASAAAAAEAFANETGEQNIYSRFTNPTVRTFEQRLAALEGGQRAVATSSGMAAILAVCMALLKQGDEIVCSRSVFGSTLGLFNRIMSKFGVITHTVELQNLAAWEAACNKNTKLLFVETPSNPLNEIADLPALADLAQRKGLRLVVDNCFCTPVLQRPLDLGAHLVVHSATKFLDGQGRMLGGAVVGSAEDMAEVFGIVRTAGPCMSSFNAWVFLKGLETLNLRMQAHSAKALAVAKWLEEQPQIAKVHYAGLESHPQHALARQQMSAFGGVLAFEMHGGQEAAWKLIDATKFLSITGNLGDAKTTITHPATTTHARLSAVEKAQVGITEGLVRISVGLEEVTDIQEDLLRGL